MPLDPVRWTQTLLAASTDLDESAASLCEGTRVPLHGEGTQATALSAFRCSRCASGPAAGSPTRA